ncbi:MAG: hypothetical protein IPO40_09015 [Fibrobacteres bacterium]|nr:hypothetical protein [Fibrobacterota bacterium]
MRRFLGKAVAVGLGLASVHVQAQSTLSDCKQTPSDKSWSGKAISAQSIGGTQMVAVLGEDGEIRLNEVPYKAQAWKGWRVLPYIAGSSPKTSVWMQSHLYLQSKWNIFATDQSSYLSQWICTGPDFKCTPARRTISSVIGNNRIIGHVASAHRDNLNSWGGSDFLFATFSDGVLRHQIYSTAEFGSGSWTGNWLDLGLSNVQSSPYALQQEFNKISLFARLANGSIMHRLAKDGVWGNWTQLPTTTPTGAIAKPTTGEISALYVIAPEPTIYLYSLNTNGYLQYQTSTNDGLTWSGWKTANLFLNPGYTSLSSVRTGDFSWAHYVIDPARSNSIKSWPDLAKSVAPTFVNCVSPKIINGP